MSIGSVVPGRQPSTLQVQAHDLRFASSDRPVAQRPTRPSPPTNLKDSEGGGPVVRCPVCTKIQLVYMQVPTRTSCYYCGARWFQSGDEQDSIIGLAAPPSALRSMGQRHSTTEGTR
jgi:hypothetical protein